MDKIIYGHRGIPSLAPENSLKSFKMVLDYNIQGVEFDIHMTKDGKLVVIHDFNSLKMTGEDYEISETDYTELQSLDIGDKETIPLLEEVFDLLKKKVKYDIEIKSRLSNKQRPDLVKELLLLIEKFDLKNQVMVSSFDPLLIKEFNKLKSGIPVAIIYSKDKNVPFILRYGFGQFLTRCPIIKPHHSLLKGFWFTIYKHILKKKVYTWTVNDKETMKYAIKRGCLGVCSDNPQKLKL